MYFKKLTNSFHIQCKKVPGIFYDLIFVLQFVNILLHYCYARSNVLNIFYMAGRVPVFVCKGSLRICAV